MEAPSLLVTIDGHRSMRVAPYLPQTCLSLARALEFAGASRELPHLL